LKIAVGSDHGGYHLKEEVMKWLAENKYEVKDFGAWSTQSCDYPDFAVRVAEQVASGAYDRGVLVCGTGIGVSIVANKINGIRAALCHDTFSAHASREHNDANILTMGERVIGRGLALDILKIWLSTDFEGGRHQKRLDKIAKVEQGR